METVTQLKRHTSCRSVGSVKGNIGAVLNGSLGDDTKGGEPSGLVECLGSLAVLEDPLDTLLRDLVEIGFSSPLCRAVGICSGAIVSLAGEELERLYSGGYRQL